MNLSEPKSHNHLTANLSYIETSVAPKIRVFPKKFGKTERVPEKREKVNIYDCRLMRNNLDLDIEGFELHQIPTEFNDFYNSEEVIRRYYPEVESEMEQRLSAFKVIVFDHNVRCQVKADSGQDGVREPVDGAHNDYTLSSGPRRIKEILEDNGLSTLLSKRCALVNFWRPIRGPVEDFPLAICDAQTTTLADFIPTTIEHYQESDLTSPSLVGEIYSFKHNPNHRWFYAPKMTPDEVILLKCFDSGTNGQASFTGHTGFLNPNLPKKFTPRESIEARTLVVY